MKRLLTRPERIAWLAAGLALLAIAALEWQQPSIRYAHLQYPNDVQEKVGLPLLRDTPFAKRYRYHIGVEYSPGMNGLFYVLPDDCIVEMRIDGAPVPLQGIPPASLCDYRQGFFIDLRAYLHPGLNKVYFAIDDYGGKYGLDFKPMAFQPLALGEWRFDDALLKHALWWIAMGAGLFLLMRALSPEWVERRLLPLCAALMLAAVGYLGLYVPIYGDEISYLLSNQQLRWNGEWRSLSLYPHCPSSFNHLIPALMLPGRALLWLQYRLWAAADGNALMLWRAATVTAALLWLIATAALMKRWTHSGWRFSGGQLAALLGIGWMPMMLVLGRAELQILWCVTALLALAWWMREPAGIRRGAAAMGLLWLVLSWLFALHPKVFFLMPLLAWSAWRIGMAQPHRALRLLTWIGSFAIVAQSFRYWSDFATCPGRPILNEFLVKNGSPVHHIFTDPLGFFWQLFFNLRRGFDYIEAIQFHAYLPLNFLPPAAGGEGPAFLNTAIALALLGVLAATPVALWQSRQTALTRLRWQASACLWASAVLYIVGKNILRFYELPFIWPLLALAFVLAPLPRRATSPLAAIAAASLLWLCFSAWPLRHPDDYTQPDGSYLDNPLTQTAADFNRRKAVITEAAAKCGLDPLQPTTRLVVDDWTYPVFAATAQQPFHAWYVALEYWADDLGRHNSLPFLREQKAQGWITNCRWVQPPLADAMTRFGGYCCMSQEQIQGKPAETERDEKP